VNTAPAPKDWEKTRLNNRVRHTDGRYYARLSLNGKEIWKSLKTSHFSIAGAKPAKLRQDHRSSIPLSISLLLALCLWQLFIAPARAADGVAGVSPSPHAHFTTGAATAVQFGVHEVALTGDGSVANPFDTLVSVTFTPPSGASQAGNVQAFYDGDNLWRARVYASEVGKWKWSSRCATDPQLDGASGTFEVVESKLRGRLLPHPKNPHQWMTEDGRCFLNLNDTAYFWTSAFDGEGKPVTDDDAHAYARDAVAHGITSLRSFLIIGPKGPQPRSLRDQWRNAFFADEAMSQFQLAHFRTADARLRWLLDEEPDLYIQLVLFPMGCAYAKDQEVWQTLTPAQRERLLRYLVARYAAYPQVFWLVVNDAHYGPKYPLNHAFAQEVGEYFAQHDPWRHPLSTGHARGVEFAFPDEDWVTYLHLEHQHDLGGSLALKYAGHHKPVFLGEDRYEQDHGARLDPAHMDYWQRRLFWSWLLAGGSANYGGRWWCLQPYSQTGSHPSSRPEKSVPANTFTTQLTGLDSVKAIRDYFEQRHIELSDFEPDDALVKDAAGATGASAPKLTRRRHAEFLIYHPDAAPALDAQHTQPAADKPAGLVVDLSAAGGEFSVEWMRAADGVVQAGEPVSGGGQRPLVAPWKGQDCVVRLLQREGATGSHAERTTYTYKTVGDLPIKADVYRLPGDDVRPVIVWIHGGGLITGGRGGPVPEQRDRYLKAGYVIVSIDYRLAPETKAAGIVEDVRDAITWVRAKGPELYKIDSQRLAVIGHSAGGYLALMAGFTVEPRPRALIAFYGYGDVDGDWYAKPHEIYRRTRPLFTPAEAHQAIGAKETTNGGAKGRGNFYTYCRQNGLWPQEVVGYDPVKQPREFDRFCPVRNVTGDYPPTLLLHGDKDIDVPHEQSVAMAAALQRAGVDHELISIPGGGHGFDAKGMQDAAVSAAFDQIEIFLHKHVGK